MHKGQSVHKPLNQLNNLTHQIGGSVKIVVGLAGIFGQFVGEQRASS